MLHMIRRAAAVVAVAAAAGAAVPAATAQLSDVEPPTTPGKPALVNPGEIGERSLHVRWAPSLDNVGVAGYELRHDGGTVDVGNVTEHLLEGIDPCDGEQVAVRAYDAAGAVSPYSEPLTIYALPVVPIPGEVEQLTAVAAGSSAATLAWEPPAPAACHRAPITGYDVFRGAEKVASVSEPGATVTGLSPDTAYTFRVVAVDGLGQQSPAGVEVTVTTDSLDEPPAVVYDVRGTSTLRTLTTGTVPITGRLAPALDVVTGAFSGDLSLHPTRARLQVLGLIPVTADLAFTQADRLRGTLLDGRLTAQARFRIRVPRLFLFGALPLALPDTCQTRSATVAQLESAGRFDPFAGGRLVGTYAISDLTGCGLLSDFISTLTKGGGNTVDLALAPRAPVT